MPTFRNRFGSSSGPQTYRVTNRIELMKVRDNSIIINDPPQGCVGTGSKSDDGMSTCSRERRL